MIQKINLRQNKHRRLYNDWIQLFATWHQCGWNSRNSLLAK